MTFSIRLDHSQRLVIFSWQDAISRKDLSGNLSAFRAPDFPARYDIIHLFHGAIDVQIDNNSVVGHAIERRRSLMERDVDHEIRSAFVAVPDTIKPLVEVWTAFFPDTDQSLLIRSFDRLDEALDWLGRDPLDEARLEAFPIPGD